MISHRQVLRNVRRLGALTLIVSLFLAVSGCSSTPDIIPGPIDSAGWLSSGAGTETGTKAFKRKVQDDPFPAAMQTET